jgi:hypothetical protein
MHKTYFVLLAATTLLTAQDIQRKANIGRGFGPNEGCTVDVVVDGAAEIEIRGDTAIMRNLSGGAPQFRQFECSRPMPPNAPGFRFNAVDGRGRQELVRTPRDGGPVVVRIDDPQGGAGEYRFEVMWGPDRGFGRGPGPDPDRDHMDYQRDRERFFQGDAWRRSFFQRVREDVEHLQHTTFPFTGDQSRLSRTIFELNELQEKLGRGFYDEHELNDVMDAMGSVLQNNRLTPRDRDVLSDDLQRMRQFRDHHDDWGARYTRN